MPRPMLPSDVTRRRGVFDRFAERISDAVARASFFTAAVLLVVLWIPTVFLFRSVDTWQLVLSTLTSVAAFLLLALLQNSERRSDQALHRKIDMLAAALAVHLREEHGDASPAVQETVKELEEAVRLEERI
ncbi:MAG: uncharacterized protein JWM31_2032 [Solirubrobacterales bacterium]|nr:uncharacterized protein [Solirubrobacterales bacterium]